jgi:hypothetical protein
VNSSFICCLTDESRPLIHAVQAECINYFMLLQSKVAVVSDEEKVGKPSGRCKEVERKRIVEDISKQYRFCQNYRHLAVDRKIVAATWLLATGQAVLRRQELYTGC